MKPRALRFLLTIAAFLTFVFTPIVPANAQSQPTGRYSPHALATYSKLRTGYESPVEILHLRGGKLGANEKLKIEVVRLKNETAKNIKAIKFKSFIFNRRDLNDVLETVQTAIFALDIPAFEQRSCKILILNVDDIPLLAYKPGEEFRLEVAVAEVHYDDGSIWQSKDLPGKLVLPELR